MRQNTRKKRGQAMVESALVVTVVLMMLVGAFDLGQIFFVHQSLVERARLSARYASINYDNPTGAKNMFLYREPNPADLSASGFLGVTDTMVTVTRLDSGTNQDRMQVKVSDYPYHFLTPYVSGNFTGKPITATAPTEVRDGW